MVREQLSDSTDWRPTIVWYNVLTLGLWHLGALYGLSLLLNGRAAGSVGLLALVLWWASGLGITAGAHRLWAHRAYKARFPLRVVLAALNSMAFQGSIWEWARDHRTHHKGSDTDADPHNIRRGFFFSHMGWVMLRKHPKVFVLGRKIPVADLEADVVVSWQRRHYLLTVLVMCYAIPTLLGHALAGDAWAGFWVCGVLRHVWVLHMTWLVNSAAHSFGDRPYDPSSFPRENFLVTVGAIGEGWHNFHHAFPNDYAAGEYGLTQGTWNPTKLFIDICAVVGLAYELKQTKRETLLRCRSKNTATAVVSSGAAPNSQPIEACKLGLDVEKRRQSCGYGAISQVGGASCEGTHLGFLLASATTPAPRHITIRSQCCSRMCQWPRIIGKKLEELSFGTDSDALFCD